jgi:hypothetical protein
MDIEKKLDVLDWMKIHYLDRECLNKTEEKELDNFINELKKAINYTRCCTELLCVDSKLTGFTINQKYKMVSDVDKEHYVVKNDLGADVLRYKKFFKRLSK